MAASTETQRLISVSLGKIAQSRGQRGGINLHKNLLVATVLHKARTAYMMESYSYKQKQEQFLLQSQQQQHLQALQHASNISSGAAANCVSDKGAVCQQTAAPDSNMGQPTATPLPSEEIRSEVSAATGSEAAAHEPMTLQESDPEVVFDKENSPPGADDRLVSQDNNTVSVSERSGSSSLSQPDHLFAATQLSLDAQLASSDYSSGSGKQQSSGNTTCNSSNVLKRRRDNPSACASDYECPVSKKARVSHEGTYSHSHAASYTDFSSDISDCSSDESDSESEPEAMYTSETPQINNLVTIFNSGFSGLCAVTNQADLSSSSSGCQSDRDLSSNSSSSQFSNRNKLRPESPSPAFSRKMSEPSLLCSSQVGRLESLPSAIVLSA